MSAKQFKRYRKAGQEVFDKNRDNLVSQNFQEFFRSISRFTFLQKVKLCYKIIFKMTEAKK